MKSPLEDTIWGASYGSVAAVQAAFDRLGRTYHEASAASGVPVEAARALMPHLDAFTDRVAGRAAFLPGWGVRRAVSADRRPGAA